MRGQETVTVVPQHPWIIGDRPHEGQESELINGCKIRPNIGRPILANVADLIAFRRGMADAELLEPYLGAGFRAGDLPHLPDHAAVGRFPVGGRAALSDLFRTKAPTSLAA